MIYPAFLKHNDTIGVSAPSAGCKNKTDRNKMLNAKENITNLGYKIRLTDNCKISDSIRSSDAIIRAREMENLFLDNDVKAIICLSGGEFLMEVLSTLRYDIIYNNPKWIQGYSDPTGLLFTITTNLDIATIYASNFKTFSMQNWHKSLFDNFEILKGNITIQNSFDLYEKECLTEDSEYEIYNLNTKSNWKCLDNNPVNIKGRLIGGCLDVLLNIIGTKFDKTKNFIEKYKEDGIIWYFDIYDKSNEDIERAMWQLKEAGWFKHIKGILFGRLIEEKSNINLNFMQSLKDSLEDLNIPVLYNLDIGHVPPRFTIINGAIAIVNYSNNKGNIKMFLQ